MTIEDLSLESLRVGPSGPLYIWWFLVADGSVIGLVVVPRRRRRRVDRAKPCSGGGVVGPRH